MMPLLSCRVLFLIQMHNNQNINLSMTPPLTRHSTAGPGRALDDPPPLTRHSTAGPQAAPPGRFSGRKSRKMHETGGFYLRKVLRKKTRWVLGSGGCHWQGEKGRSEPEPALFAEATLRTECLRFEALKAPELSLPGGRGCSPRICVGGFCASARPLKGRPHCP